MNPAPWRPDSAYRAILATNGIMALVCVALVFLNNRVGVEASLAALVADTFVLVIESAVGAFGTFYYFSRHRSRMPGWAAGLLFWTMFVACVLVGLNILVFVFSNHGSLTR